MRNDINIFFILMMALALLSCGSGATSDDPLGTDTLSVTATPTELNKGESSIITAIVKDAGGKEVVGREVTFGFVANETGATLTFSHANTSAAGEVKVLYRAGPAAGTDVVRASLSNGARMDVNIAVGAGGFAITVTAEPPSLAAGAMSNIVATVKNAKGVAMPGQAVSFAFVTNNSGATLTTLNGGITDASGKATAVYTAGGNDPEQTITDAVSATAGSNSGTAIITRAAGTTPPSGAVIILSTSTLLPLDGGQTCTITARVTGGANAGADEAVFFRIPVNNSGATFINADGASVSTITLTTGTGGTASVIYRAGTNNPGSSVQDTVEGVALSSGSFYAVTITRSAGVAGYAITVSADPSTLTATTGESIVTANVKDNTGAAVGGVTVTFSVTGTGGGSFSTASPKTNSSGNAITIFTGAAGGTGTAIVQASTTIGGNTYTGAVTITIP